MLHSEVLSVVVPDGEDFVCESLGCWIAVCIGVNDGLHALWVEYWLNELIIVADQVVVQLDSSWLLLVDDNISNVKEQTANLGVVSPELSCSIDGSSALVSLEDDKEAADKLLAFGPEEFHIQVNEEVCILFLDLELNKLALSWSTLLVLVEELREHVGSPCVSLTPLLILSVEQLKTEDTLAELVHDVNP